MKTGEVIAKYVTLRDKKNKLVREQKEEVAKYTEKLDMIETWLLREYQKEGLTSQKGLDGSTAFIKSADTCTVKDRDAFLNFIKDNDHFELADIRASKTVIRDYMEETGNLPPGLSWSSIDKINVRKGK